MAMPKISFFKKCETTLALGAAVLLAGCDGLSLPGVSEGEEEAAYADRSVEALYNNAMDNLEAGWHETAAALFDEL